MGVRYFCDRCEKEFKSNGLAIETWARDAFGAKIAYTGIGLLCETCAKKFNKIKDCLEDEEDFFNMSDDEISLMKYNLKDGTKVKDLAKYCQEIKIDCGICQHKNACDNFSRFLSEGISPSLLIRTIEKNIKF